MFMGLTNTLVPKPKGVLSLKLKPGPFIRQCLTFQKMFPTRRSLVIRTSPDTYPGHCHFRTLWLNSGSEVLISHCQCVSMFTHLHEQELKGLLRE